MVETNRVAWFLKAGNFLDAIGYLKSDGDRARFMSDLRILQQETDEDRRRVIGQLLHVQILMSRDAFGEVTPAEYHERVRREWEDMHAGSNDKYLTFDKIHALGAREFGPLWLMANRRVTDVISASGLSVDEAKWLISITILETLREAASQGKPE